MDLEIFNNIKEEITNIKNEMKKNNISEEMELAKKLDAIEEYSVDRFEGEYAKEAALWMANLPEEFFCSIIRKKDGKKK